MKCTKINYNYIDLITSKTIYRSKYNLYRYNYYGCNLMTFPYIRINLTVIPLAYTRVTYKERNICQ